MVVSRMKKPRFGGVFSSWIPLLVENKPRLSKYSVYNEFKFSAFGIYKMPKGGTQGKFVLSTEKTDSPQRTQRTRRKSMRVFLCVLRVLCGEKGFVVTTQVQHIVRINSHLRPCQQRNPGSSICRNAGLIFSISSPGAPKLSNQVFHSRVTRQMRSTISSARCKVSPKRE